MLNGLEFKKQTHMALQTLNTIKDWFKTGLKPSQTQFWDTWDSFRHKNDKVPVKEVEGLDEIIDSKADKMILDNHLTDDAAHADLFNDKEDKTQKGAPDGYAPLDEFTKLAAQYLNIVNDLVTGGAESLLSAEQGKVLQMQVNAINNLLTSDNMNLDTVQELVDTIETVQLSLNTILINDLSTGGTTKALTAEMGKQLDLIKESTANKSTSIVVDYLSNIKFPSVKAVYDFCMSAFKKKFLAFGEVPGITHTFGVGSENTMFKFSNNNPITTTIPTNATTPFEIGTVFETIAIGTGALTLTGAPGVTILTNLSNTSVKNEVRRYTKIDTDTWTVQGNIATTATDNFFVKILGKTFVNSILREGVKGIMLGVSDFNWGGSGRFFRFGNRSSLSEASSGAIILLTGAYEGGINQYKYIATGQPASYIRLSSSGGLSFFTAPSGIIDDFVYFSERFTITQGGRFLLNSEENNTDLMHVGGPITAIQYNLENLNGAPLSSTSPGRKGEIRFSEGHIYLCVNTNSWVRTALTTW